MTDRLKSVGLWATGTLLDTNSCLGWIHPRHLQRAGWNTRDRARILAYLRSGTEWAGYRGQSRCRLGCEAPNGSRDQTDGVWVWPEGLAHYVEAHDVRLPEAFVDTMRAHGFAVPQDAPERRKQGFDGEPWLRWCAEQVPAPPAHDDALSLSQAQALASSLSVPGYQAQVEAFAGRWLIAARFPSARMVDLLPPCAADTLALHLHRWRRVPPDQQLSLQAASQILSEVISPPTVWDRLRDWAHPGSANLTAVTADPTGFWRLSAGSVTTSLMPIDEVGWRFLLSQLRPGNPAVYVTINRRLSAALGDGGQSV